MKRILFALILSLAASGAAHPKLSVRVVVDTPQDDKIERELQEAIEAKLNSTERYRTATFEVPDLFFEVECMLPKVSDKKVSIACSSHASYLPYKRYTLDVILDGAAHMAMGPLNSIADIANRLTNSFINGTTDDVLAAKKVELTRNIRSFCSDNPNECR